MTNDNDNDNNQKNHNPSTITNRTITTTTTTPSYLRLTLTHLFPLLFFFTTSTHLYPAPPMVPVAIFGEVRPLPSLLPPLPEATINPPTTGTPPPLIEAGGGGGGVVSPPTPRRGLPTTAVPAPRDPVEQGLGKEYNTPHSSKTKY